MDFFGKDGKMREEKNQQERVTRRSSTGTRRDTERAQREPIRMFDETAEKDRDRREEPRDRYNQRQSRRFENPLEDDRYDDRYDDRRDRYDDRRDHYDERREHYDDRRDRYDDRREQEESRRNDHREETQRPQPKKPAPRKQAGRRRRTGGDTERFVHQVVPYVTFWLALFAAVSFVLRDLVHMAPGAFGNWMADFLCGLFGPGAYVVPLFLVVISLRWRKYVREGLLAIKLILSSAFVVLLSAIIHVFMDGSRGILDVSMLYTGGVIRTSGGFFGGFVGEYMGYLLYLPGTILLAIPLLLIIGIYLLGMTPSGLWQRISLKVKQSAQARKEREAANYDGKEERPLRVGAKKPESVAAQSDTPRVAAPAEVLEEEGEPDDRVHYDFREDELPPKAPKKRKEERRSEQPQQPELLDIPDDEPEMDEPPVGTRVILERAGHTDDTERTLSEILDSLAEESAPQKETFSTPPSVPTPTPVPAASTKEEPEEPERELQGTVYSPFSLHQHFEPKKEKAPERDTTAHIVVQPRRDEVEKPVREDHTLRGTTTVGSLGTMPDYTAPYADSAAKEETLGNTRPYNPIAEEAPAATPVAQQPTPVAQPSAPMEKPREAVISPRTAEAVVTDAFAPYPSRTAAPVADKPQSTMSFEEDEDEDDRTPLSAGLTFGEEEKNEPSVAPATPTTPAAPVQESAPFTRVRLAEEPVKAPTSEASAPEKETPVFERGTVAQPAAAAAPARGMRTSFSLPGEEEPEKATAPAVEELAQAAAQPQPTRPPIDLRSLRPQRPVAARTEVIKEDPKPVAPPPPPREHRLPPIDLLNEDKSVKNTDHSEEIQEKIDILRDTLASFNVRVKEQVDCSRGPTITRYELRPEAGVSVRSVINRIDDISLNLAAPVRIEAPIPGKPAIGIEVPNATRETVYMRTLLESEVFKNAKKPLEVPLGLGVGGDIQMCNLASMPHLLVAGTTGSGKSVCINTILIGLMYKTAPRDLRLILIDPKQIEFAAYAHVPHLYVPIVTEPAQAVGALACAVQEMERRYSLIKDVGVRDIDSYNEAVKNDPEREHLPRMVIVIDEFADLKMACPNNDVENFTCRIAQKARAAGMHLIIGTQRPSVDVITGKLKNNIPSRIAFTVMQQVDSRTILDINGAESLTGKGDMLYMPVGCPKPARVQGAYVSDGEVERVVSFVRDKNDPVQYNRDFMDQIEAEVARAANVGKKGDDFDNMDDGDDDGEDPKFREAVVLAIETQKVATSLLQRRLGVGYGRAAKIIDRMEELGYVSAPEGNKARKVLITAQEYAARMMEGDEGEYEEDDYS